MVVCVAVEEVEDIRNTPVDEEDGYGDDQAGEELELSSAMARATAMGGLGLDLPGGGGAGRNEGKKGNPREKKTGHYRHPWEEIGKEEASLERIHGDPTDPKREKHSGAEAMAAGG